MSAVDTYEVGVASVLGVMPVDTTEISSTSKPLSTADIVDYIERGAAEINTLIGNADVSASDGVTRQQCRTAVIAYAARESMKRMGMLGTQAYRDLSDEWNLVTAKLAKSNNIAEKSSNRTQSTGTGRTRKFSGSSFGGF